MRKNIVILMVMLLVVGCTDHDEEIGVVPDSQNGSELLIEETSGLQFQPEDLVSNLYNGMMTDEKDGDFTPVATTVLKMVGKVMTNAFGNFISQQTPALDKLFETEAGQGKQANHCWQIESYSFNYHSKSARGEDVVLSGRVTFPNHKTSGIGHQVKSLTLNMHHALNMVSMTPSQMLDLWILRAYFNEAVIEPDGQGLGVNLGKDYHCTVSSDVLARQMADCTLAALEVMRQHGVTLAADGHSICTS